MSKAGKRLIESAREALQIAKETPPMDSKIEPVAWRYAINYGPDGEQNYANVYDGNGNMVGNLKTHHAIAIVSAMNGSAFDKAPLPEPKAWLFKPTGAIVDPLAKALLVKRFSEELQRDVSVDFEALVPAAARALVNEMETTK